ncbi:MAG: extracellular solute-binding protein [Arsenophonus sp.]|nr:MAG: extracellular solute-binding protein [Arsenophonus sp.]
MLSFLIIHYFSISFADGRDKKIYFYNWSEYIPTGLLSQFTKETGIKVIYSTYESNESMYTKLKSNPNSHYDLIVPSTYFISKMRNEDMLTKINRNKLTHFNNLDPSLLNKSFDPNNDFSIPYIWGATGIGVNQKITNKLNIESWADLWNPIFKKKILLTNDAREVFQIALLKLGYSGNTKDKLVIKKAYEELIKLMPNVRMFNSDNPAYPFIQGEIEIGMMWNGSAFLANQQSDMKINFIWPKEGGIFWMDSLAIPKNAENIEGALKLIDFLLRPDIAALVAKKIGYPTPNLTAKKQLSTQILSDINLYPSKSILDKGEWQDDVGETSLIYEDYFQKLKLIH